MSVNIMSSTNDHDMGSCMFNIAYAMIDVSLDARQEVTGADSLFNDVLSSSHSL